ncbi:MULTISPECIES: PAAR domain-containing protein [Paenibacillus]|uniref:PAAR domain-containing protein n=1 Tax=Paenibacillus alvei TaxID=44250 RepID=A0ABT4EHF7_PAEAL|nr:MULTISPECIES: PAAR domain-containing protein [Paenibacillus]MCY9532520.1 PAAR domain-containing protein [Paenibacillus alvei]SDE40400.1 PAAR motif-containing protein [Paenibacillus sp. cl6col]
MAEMAYKGARTNPSVASNHVRKYRYVEGNTCLREREDGSCAKYNEVRETDYTDAYISGVINSDRVSNVFVNGRPVACTGDSVTETESYSLGGWKLDYSDEGGTGHITGGSSTVYVNGRQVATAGSSVTTHARTTTTIAEGSSNVHIN